jgi:hypothetical protein
MSELSRTSALASRHRAVTPFFDPDKSRTHA